MKTKSKSIVIHSSPEQTFAFMDNLSNTGMHMMENSAMMMGSKLRLEQLSDNPSGFNAKYRWYGTMMGMRMDFTTLVTLWVKDREKIWETIGKAKMIILKWYRMHLELLPGKDRYESVAKLSIDYTLPDNIFLRLFALVLSPWYANWCLKNMLNDSKEKLEHPGHI
jgi:hypothetical protein